MGGSEAVIVGINTALDHSPALSWSIEVCSTTGAALVAVTACCPDQAEIPPTWHDELIADAERELRERIEPKADRLPHRSRVLEGDPASVLREVAESEQAPLVVVGTNSNHGRAAMGAHDVVHQLSHDLTAPLVIVPCVGGALRGGTIVVGVDGSDESRAALTWAVDMAKRIRGAVHAVFAYDPMADSYPHGASPNWKYRGQAEVEAEVNTLARDGVDVRLTLVGDDPIDALTAAGNSDDAAVIAVGAKQPRGLQGLLLGHIASGLPDAAGRPVAIVHDSAQRGGPAEIETAAPALWHRLKGHAERLAGWLTGDRTVEAEGEAEIRTAHMPRADEVDRVRRQVKRHYG